MKRIITTAIMAMLLSVGIASAQEKIKINDVIYVIDHKIVASSLFDGSQLVNKTIASYQVDSELGLHIIFTSDYTKEKNVYQTKVVTKEDGITVVSYDKKGNTVASTNIVTHPETVHVVDGKVITADEFMAISPSKIESITNDKKKHNPNSNKNAKANTELFMKKKKKK